MKKLQAVSAEMLAVLILLAWFPSYGVLAEELSGTHWQLISFQSMNDSLGTIRPDNPSSYTMQLNADGTVNFQLDCNRAKGSWSVGPGNDEQSGRFSFGPLAATRALCPQPNLDEKIIADSKYVRSYLMRDGNLHLSLQADAGIYTWSLSGKPAVHATVPALSPEEGGPLNWRVAVSGLLNLREQPSIKAKVISKYLDGTLLDNLGCRVEEGRTWCDVQQLGGGQRGYVAAEYLAPAISPDGSIFTGIDDSALRAGQEDFDATGDIPCAQTSG